ncbi:hypothetical protein O1611_g547 [Lasiodiplodia mahajangana]|uniref:Uncharacterized protein n=1 Tax=Lasiodiplodia mahajangana TaxID=1108764 RepID=A0ACC2K0N1_9PEZI|nr:hypothetical protein O1611_g547 [Lasiodiplodia mahajangana]
MAQAQSEIIVVNRGKATNVDIVFILGPGQKRLDPWMSRPSVGDGITWLGERLGVDFPNARVSVYRYSEHEAWNYEVHAVRVREHLERARGGDERPHPILLVAYGLGGIVSAQPLQQVDEHAAKILELEAIRISPDCGEVWYNAVKKLLQELAQVETTPTDGNRVMNINVAGDLHGGSHRNNSGNVSYVYNGSG